MGSVSPVIFSDFWPRFKGHGIFDVDYLKNKGQSFYRTLTGKPYLTYRMVPLSMTFTDFWPGFQDRNIFEVEYRKKTARVKHQVSTAH